jgi:hypothetical protein
MTRAQALMFTFLAALLTAVIVYFPWDRSGRVQVSGTVRLDGHPLTVIRGSSIAFVSADHENRTAVGLIDEGGRYRLDTTRQQKGIFPGRYRVAIKAWERVPGWDDTKSGAPLPPEAVPEHYTDSDTSDLVVEVTTAPRQTIEIDLRSGQDR